MSSHEEKRKEDPGNDLKEEINNRQLQSNDRMHALKSSQPEFSPLSIYIVII